MVNLIGSAARAAQQGSRWEVCSIDETRLSQRLSHTAKLSLAIIHAALGPCQGGLPVLGAGLPRVRLHHER